MIALRPCSRAKRTAGSRYARDLPTPVPASARRERSCCSAVATAAASCCCWGRNSNPRPLESTPSAEKSKRLCATRSSTIREKGRKEERHHCSTRSPDEGRGRCRGRSGKKARRVLISVLPSTKYHLLIFVSWVVNPLRSIGPFTTSSRMA